MRRIHLAAPLVLCLILSPLRADQNDPRLDSLFEDLQSTPDPELAHSLEQRIWIVWLRSGDEAIDALMTRGIAAMNRRRYDTALEVFDRIVEQAPEFAEGWNKRATVHYLRGDYVASMRDVQRTLELEPRHFGALSGMGLIFLATGDERAALRAFQEVLEVHPLSPGTRVRVEELRRQLRDTVI